MSARLVREIEGPADIILSESSFVRAAQAFENLAEALGPLTADLVELSRAADRGPSLRAYRKGLVETERALESATIPVMLNSGLYILLGLGFLAAAAIYSKVSRLLRVLENR